MLYNKTFTMGKQHDTFPEEKPDMPVPMEAVEIDQSSDPKNQRFHRKIRKSFRMSTHPKIIRLRHLYNWL